MKRLRIFALAVFALCLGVMFLVELARANQPHTITLSGTGTVLQVSATDLQASSIQFTAPAANSGIARLGDQATTSSSVGEALPAGSGQYFPPRFQGAYSLNSWWVYVANGDKVTVLWTDTQ